MAARDREIPGVTYPGYIQFKGLFFWQVLFLTFLLIHGTNPVSTAATTNSGDVSLPLLAAFPPERLPALARALRQAIADLERKRPSLSFYSTTGHSSDGGTNVTSTWPSSSSRGKGSSGGTKGHGSGVTSTSTAGGVSKDGNAFQVSFLPASVGVPDDSSEAIGVLCAGLEAHKPQILLSFLGPPRSFFPALVGGHSAIPVLGLTQGYADRAAEYSKLLNKLFVNFYVPCPVKFFVDPSPPEGSYIRATAYFKDPAHVDSVVVRCLTHQADNQETNIGILVTLNKSSDAKREMPSIKNTQPVDDYQFNRGLLSALDSVQSEVNRLYLSLDPVPEDLAEATYQLLRANQWFYTAIVADESRDASCFVRRMKTLASKAPWAPIKVVTLGTNDNDTSLLEQLSVIQASHVRVILLYCDRTTAWRILAQARSLTLLNGDWVWLVLDQGSWWDSRRRTKSSGSSEIRASMINTSDYPPGLLGLRLKSPELTATNLRRVVEVVADAIEALGPEQFARESKNVTSPVSCWFPAPEERKKLSVKMLKEMTKALESKRKQRLTHPDPTYDNASGDRWGPIVFDVVNLVPRTSKRSARLEKERQRRPPTSQQLDPLAGKRLYWKSVGNVTRHAAYLDSVLWLGQSKLGPPPVRRPRFRVVTGYAPPFVFPTTRVENGSCLTGITCLQVSVNTKAELAAIFADYNTALSKGLPGGNKTGPLAYNVSCCSGIAMELLASVARDLVFDVDLYVVADGVFGTLKGKKWNGITSDLISGAAHMTFAAFSITSARASVVDFSVPYFHSGVSCLTYSQYYEVPLSVFLVPFSIQLWIAIFASLNATAIAAALYEWFSPFGLNPWGRQRTKNFSLASALWVMWSLLFSHLVAFKAPKSWPNKVLINLWGCFSVIFLASYTANIAALFAGLFFHLRVDDFHDAALLSQRTGTAKSSAAEGYVHAENPKLWQHIQMHGVSNLEEGLVKLRAEELDVLIGDTAVLNYFRGNDPKCNLHQGDTIFDDAYGVGMQKGFALKESLSELILKYNDFGYLEQLQKKWYGRVPCFDDSIQRMLKKPMPLSIQAVAGAFIMLGVGLLVGIVILFIEHGVFKYTLPVLRTKPKNCIWRSPNFMFFSQKLYRFVNTVELVSPHHSAKEIVSNLREGQIASLFQKSVKRKAKEEARRRKSKSQFFEMIQEIRRMVQQQSEEEAAEQTEGIGITSSGQARILTLPLSPMERKAPEETELLISPGDPPRHGVTRFGEDERRILISEASEESNVTRRRRGVGREEASIDDLRVHQQFRSGDGISSGLEDGSMVRLLQSSRRTSPRETSEDDSRNIGHGQIKRSPPTPSSSSSSSSDFGRTKRERRHARMKRQGLSVSLEDVASSSSNTEALRQQQNASTVTTPLLSASSRISGRSVYRQPTVIATVHTTQQDWPSSGGGAGSWGRGRSWSHEDLRTLRRRGRGDDTLSGSSTETTSEDSPSPVRPSRQPSPEGTAVESATTIPKKKKKKKRHRKRSRGAREALKRVVGARASGLGKRTVLDELKLSAMSKEEIIRQWRHSERDLLNRLGEALRAKRALEEKLAFIQQTLRKPP